MIPAAIMAALCLLLELIGGRKPIPAPPECPDCRPARIADAREA